jgi:hypothetical protein
VLLIDCAINSRRRDGIDTHNIMHTTSCTAPTALPTHTPQVLAEGFAQQWATKRQERGEREVKWVSDHAAESCAGGNCGELFAPATLAATTPITSAFFNRRRRHHCRYGSRHHCRYGTQAYTHRIGIIAGTVRRRIHTVHVLIHTVLILYLYCKHTVLILYSYCTHTVLILYSLLYSYCTHTVLHTVRVLYSYTLYTTSGSVVWSSVATALLNG